MVTHGAGGTAGPGTGSPLEPNGGTMDTANANERTDVFQVEEPSKMNRIDQIVVVSDSTATLK